MNDSPANLSAPRRLAVPSHVAKYIAYLSMVIDHIGLLILPRLAAHSAFYATFYPILYPCLRLIGRFAFPIFCYFIALGCLRTRRPNRYLLRLLIIAVLSEPVFSLSLYGVLWDGPMCNVMWTLLIGALVCVTATRVGLNTFWFIGLAASFMFLAGALHTDYGAPGVMLICGSYWILRQPTFRQTQNADTGNYPRQIMAWAGLLFAFAFAMVFFSGSSFREYAVLLLAPVLAGIQLSTHKLSRWWYFFYPGHLLLFVLVQQLL